MKSTKSRSLIYLAILVSFVALIIFYALTYKNLQKTLGQTEDEKVVLKMMLHLDLLQSSENEIEADIKPSWIFKNRNKLDKYKDACSTVKKQISELKDLCQNKDIPCSDILILDSLVKRKLIFSDSVVTLVQAGRAGDARKFVNSEKSELSRTELVNKIQDISEKGRLKLKKFEDERNLESQNIYTLFGLICLGSFILLIFIFWRLLKQTTAKDALLSENKIFGDIINNTFDLILMYDKDLRVTYCNDATLKLYKLKRSDIIGHVSRDVFKTRYSKEEVEERLAFLHANGYLITERKDTDSEGNLIELQTAMNAIKDEQGDITGYFAINTDITALKKSQQEVEAMALSLKKANDVLEERVQEQTALATDTFARVQTGFIAADANLFINYHNELLKEILGLREKMILGKKLLDVLLPIIGIENIKNIQDSFASQQEKHFEFFYSPTQRWYHGNIYPSFNGISMYFSDVTIRKKATEGLEKSNRLYQFISDVNDLVLHSKTADEIFSNVSKIALQSGGFRFNWIGITDKETKKLNILAHAGHDDGYLHFVKEAVDRALHENDYQKLPLINAIIERRYFYSNDIENDLSMELWRDACLKRGFHSVIGLPIKLNEDENAFFVIYADRPNFFTEEEVTLLVRVTENISHVLNTLSSNQKRVQAEKQLRKVLQAVEQSAASIVITDLKGSIEYVNPAFSKLTGYTFEEMMGKNPRILKSGYTTAAEYSELWKNITNKKEWSGIFSNKKKNGDVYWEYAIISPILDEEGRIINYVAVKENITERKQLEDEQKQLSKIIENTEAYVAIADINRNFLYGNKALKAALEIEEDEDISKYNIADFRSAKGEAIIAEANKIVLKEGRWTGENSYISKSGKEIPVLQVIVLHKTENGEPIHISTTAIDLSKAKAAEKELLLINNELREFTEHLQNISESEKRQIAREIHDELGQNLTAIKFSLSWFKKHLNDDKEILEERIDELITEVTDTIGSFRRIQTSLHPAMLEELGLCATLEWMLNVFCKSTNIKIEQTITPIEKNHISFEKSLLIYRVAQESLNNIKRYSNATHVSFTLLQEDDSLSMNIKDNGCGFDIASVDTKIHHGILGMRERLYAVDGKFKIHSVIGEGTFIDITVPIN